MNRFPLLLLPALAACYTYVPIEPAAVGPGASVRVRVSPAAAARIAPLLGGADSRVVAGTIIENAPAGMIVEIPTIVPTDVGSSLQTLHQRVSIARNELVELETRTLDRFRTGSLAAAVAIVVGTAVFKSVKRDPALEKLPGGTSTDNRAPFLRP